MMCRALLCAAAIGCALGAVTLEQGQFLVPGQTLTRRSRCDNLQLVFAYQTDGNLVLYHENHDGPPRVLWSSGTAGTTPHIAVLQGDGNFVIYSPTGSVWHSGTHNRGRQPYRLELQDDNEVALFSGDGVQIWRTGTACQPPAIPPTPNYFGCWRDQPDRALPERVYISSMTVQACRGACRQRNYPYAGLQYANECWCGTNYARHGPGASDACNMRCEGDPQTFCGAGWHNSVYSTEGAPLPTSPPGPAPTPTGCQNPGCSGGAKQWADYAACVAGDHGCGNVQSTFANFGDTHADFTTQNMAQCYEWLKQALSSCNTMQLIRHTAAHPQCTNEVGHCKGFSSTGPHLHLQQKGCGKFRHAIDRIDGGTSECDCSKVTDIGYLCY